MPPRIERTNVGLLELKFAPTEPDAQTEEMSFTGYGAVFNNIDSYGDMILPGAFAHYLSAVKSGATVWPIMLLQHGGWEMTAEDMTPIGVWTDLAEDGTGLKVAGKLADTPRGREIYTLMKMEPRPAIDGLSIGYIAKEWEPRSKPEDPRRQLKRIELMEISPVTFPANGKARVGQVKSGNDEMTIRDAEEALRDAGFSRKEAKAILAGGFKSMPLRDAGGDGIDELAAILRKNIAALNA
jgi:uncharacterized protein